MGARDSSLWRDVRAVELSHRLLFAGESRWWGGGGVAFIDPELSGPSTSTTLARAYLITVEQFQDVLAQESGRAVGTEVDLEAAADGGWSIVGEGNYDRVVHVGHHDWPMLTFTTPREIHELHLNPPGQAYHDMIVRGVVEAHGLTEDEARHYIASHAA